MEFVSPVVVGARIESGGNFATVRYIGEVPPAKGVWLGVEWDDEERGKHDGTHEGHRYFTTKEPTSGSFIREKKANFGMEFMQAVQERYGMTEDENAGVIEEELYVMGKHQQTVVEMVGARSVNLKQSQLDHLQELVLRDTGIARAGADGAIMATVPRVCELDISRNLIPSWKELARITQQLKELTSLNISENVLEPPEDFTQLASCFRCIKTLYLNRMGYSWQQITECIQTVHNLQALHVCFNNISSLSSVKSVVPNLRLLNVESNAVCDWSQVLLVGDLPHLDTLILNDTGVSEIFFPDVPHSQTTSYFPKLKHLCVNNNKLHNWSSIDELNKLACLQELKIKRNPLVEPKEMDDATIRTLIIAKLPKLKLVNRSEVLKVERKGAELDYLKLYGRDWLAAGGNQNPSQNKPSEKFCQEHPRYQQLIDKYGAPEDSELKVHTSALRSNLLNLTIDCPYIPDKAPLKKKLPVTMTVSKLKAMLQRIYKCDPLTMYITYTSPQSKDQEFELENDMREIGFYAVEEGDRLHVKWH